MLVWTVIELMMMICLKTYLECKTKHFLFNFYIQYMFICSFLLAFPFNPFMTEADSI